MFPQASPLPRILAIEPIFGDFTHSLGNAYQLQALALARCASRIVFAAHPGHWAAVQSNEPTIADGVEFLPIEISPGGGITHARYRCHLRELTRAIDVTDADCVICLAVTPETLFACTRLRIQHPRLPIIAVLHGDLSKAVGWRSRDPRRRWFDQRSAIRAATWAGIKFVVMEEYVKRAALEINLVPEKQCDVWLHPIADQEHVPEPPPLGSGKIRLGFLGFAKREKGFDDFLSLIEASDHEGADWCEFYLIGTVAEPAYQSLPRRLTVVPNVVNRANYAAAVQSIDYACIFLESDTYRLTSSGSVVDAIAALRPMISLDTQATRAMFRGVSVGHVRPNRHSLRALMNDRAALCDTEQYRGFQDGLMSLRRGRAPRELAKSIAETIHDVMDHQHATSRFAWLRK